MARLKAPKGRILLTIAAFIGVAWVYDQTVFALIAAISGDAGVRFLGIVLIHAAVVASVWVLVRGRISSGGFTALTVIYAGLAALALLGFSYSTPLRLTEVPLHVWPEVLAFATGRLG